jgi:tRNA dimethylallyltransferase
MGPTASGKSAAAEALADELDAVLINGDAFQCYRGFDIGTAKPVRRSRYRLIDALDPHEMGGVGWWAREAMEILVEAFSIGRSAVVVGGTGFWIRALMDEYDGLKPPPPEGLRAELAARLEAEGLEALGAELEAKGAAEGVDLKNPHRVLRALERALDDRPPLKIELPPFRRLKAVIDWDPEALAERIDLRLEAAWAAGWPREAAGLRARGFEGSPAWRAIGYQEAADAADGRISEAAAKVRIALLTRQYAKQQRTWLRSEGCAVRLPGEDSAQALAALASRAE